MGRVRRYKKVKAIDPFSKGKKNKVNDKDRNLPPDVKNHQAQRLNNLQEGGKNKKKLKRRLPQWAHDELKETAKRVREEHDDPEGQKRRLPEPQRPTIEGKREDESMRQFNKRVKQGTAQLLRDEFKEHSATNKRRKQYLDEKKRKNKLKKQGKWEEVKRRERIDEDEGMGEEEGAAGKNRGVGRGFNGPGGRGSGGQGSIRTKRQGHDEGQDVGFGLGRADDEEGASFAGAETIRFGDVAHAPPNLAKIPKPRGFKDQGQAKPWSRHGITQNDKSSSSSNNPGAGGRAGRPGGGDGVVDEAQREAAKAQKRQMEELRQRVQDAYSGLKTKRRAGQTQFVGSDL